MEGRGILSPQRSRFSPRKPKKNTPDGKPGRKVDKNGSKQKVTPIPKAVGLPSNLKPSEPSTSLNPNNNYKNKSTSEPSSPAPLLTPTTPSPSPNTNLGKANASKSGSLDPQKDVQKSTDHGDRNQNHRFSRAVSDTAALPPPDFSDRFLQRLSFDGKDLADILQGNSIYDLISPNKKEESSSQSNDRSIIFQIYKKIASHRQENSSVETYFTKLEELWVELVHYTADLVQFSNDGAPIGNPMGLTEKEKVMQFLMGLDDSYATICSQILFMNPFPTVEKAYSEISREEKRRELVVALETMAAKVIQTNWLLRNNGRSNNNGDTNHGRDKEVDNK